MDKSEAAYRWQVYNIWVASKFARTFADDLINVLLDNGFLVDNVTVSYSDCDQIRWIGRCYDESLTDYKFDAVWTVNMEKFTASDVHYYDLTCLDIEPL